MTPPVADTLVNDALTKSASTSASGIVDLTIVICTRNRADDLAFTLRSLADATVPHGTMVELIVVDNASDDETKSVIDENRDLFGFDVHYVYERVKGLSAARNAGIASARGSYIAWTDDDCIVSKDWIAAIIRHFNENIDTSMLGGRVLLHDPTDYPVSINTSTEAIALSRVLTFPGALLYGCNMAFRRTLVEEIGKFDVRFGAGSPLRAAEDADFVYRAFIAGFEVCYEPDVVVYHNHHRKTREQAMLVRAAYAFSDGAFLMKYILKGDRLAARFLYWRAVNTVRPFLITPSFRYESLSHLKLAFELLRGAGTYALLSSSWVLRPRRGNGPVFEDKDMAMHLLPCWKRKMRSIIG